MSAALTAAHCAEALATVRATGPLVHNVTNLVVMNVTANAILAVGGSPIMAENPEEMAELVAIVGASVVNLGSVSGDLPEAMRLTASESAIQGKPWVFDPVAFGVLGFRTRLGTELLAHTPTVIRANASEALAVAGTGAAGKGVDSTASSQDAAVAAQRYAQQTGSIMAITGAVDVITDGTDTIRLANGHPMMARITGTGCQSSALVGVFLAAGVPPLLAATAALACFGIAGEKAAQSAAGPGSLQVGLFDQLHRLTPEEVAQRCQLT